MDRETAREWINLELDGQLPPAEGSRLHESLAADPGLAREREELLRLDQLLAESCVAVDARFKAQVMGSLPAAGWEARHPRSWRFAVALLLLLGALAAALVGMGSARLVPQSPFLGALGAVTDLFVAATLAGAGMLAASWKGLGLALGALAGESVASIAVLGVLVLSLNLLFFSLLRSTTRTAAASAESRWEGGRRR